jgi:hypothetical protein
MVPHRGLLLAGILSLVAPAHASSQDLLAGTRVRITAPTLMLDRQRGQLLSIDRDSLVLEGSGLDLGSSDAAPKVWIIPRDAVAELERSLGSRGNAGKGLLIGGGIGLLIGLGSTSLCQGSGDYGTFCAMIIGASTGGGALLGALFGAAARSERWESVPAAQFQ